MHADIAKRRPELLTLCRRYGVARLEVFGSAARGSDFDPARSDEASHNFIRRRRILAEAQPVYG